MSNNTIRHNIIRAFFILFIDILALLISSYISMAIIAARLSSFNDVFEKFKFNLLIDIGSIIVLFLLLRLYSASFRQFGLRDALKLALCEIILLGINLFSNSVLQIGSYPYSAVFFCIFSLFSISWRFLFRICNLIKSTFINLKSGQIPTIIIGAGDAGALLIKDIKESSKYNLKVRCFLDDNEKKIGTSIEGVPVLGTIAEITKFSLKFQTKLIIVAIPSASKQRIKEIIEACEASKCEVKIIPGNYDVVSGKVSISNLRKIGICDLLGREEVKTNFEEISYYVRDRVVLVTGGGGSIGSELCRQIAKQQPKLLIIFDIYENNAYDIEQELKTHYPDLNLLTLIGSVRDSVKLDDLFSKYRPEIVFHAAAHKHVPLMEKSPNEAVKNNVLGTYKVCKASDKFGVKRFIMISTDKAVNPTNIMGATKRICEMIIQAMDKRSNTEFVAVRFGNVLGSNGSVIPLFRKQIEEGGPVTVTDERIVRYFMTIPEAVSLVLQAGAYAKGGEIFVLDMGEPVKIYDLAKNMIKLSGFEPNVDIQIKIIGLRPGEKLYEERLMQEEGLIQTPNKMISIGKPLDIDSQKLFKELDILSVNAYSEVEDIRQLVAKIVPTYTYTVQPKTAEQPSTVAHEFNIYDYIALKQQKKV